MAKHGSLGEFDQRTGDWKSYIERAQQYFAANDVTDAEKQRAILLSSVGDKTYRTIKDVLSPDAPATVALASLIKKMTQHAFPASALRDRPALQVQYSSPPTPRKRSDLHRPAKTNCQTL